MEDSELQPDTEIPAGDDGGVEEPPLPSWPEGTILVMVDGQTRPATEAELAEIAEQQQPAPPVKRPSISKLAFLRLLVGVLEEPLGLALLQPTTRFGLIFMAAGQVDYADLFVCVDGDPEEPGYVAQLIAAELVSQAQGAALESAWPTT